MTIDQESAWRYLRDIDDPTRLTEPADYDENVMAGRVADLASALGREFGAVCRVESRNNGAIHDATFFADVIVPSDASGTPRTVARVSTFGGLATTYGGSPADRDRLTRVLAREGWVVIEDLWLRRPYDGRNKRYAVIEGDWHGRFFGYVPPT